MSIEQQKKELCVCVFFRQERERLALGQAVVAAAAEVTVKTVGRWEREIAIPADKLAALTSLGFDAQYVVTGIRSSQALSADEEQLLALFRAAPLAVKASTLGGLAAGGAPPSVRIQGNVGQNIESGVQINKPITINMDGKRGKQ